VQLSDGHTDHTEAPAYEYRLAGGVYRRGRTYATQTRGEVVITYRWRVDDSRRRNVPNRRRGVDVVNDGEMRFRPTPRGV